MTRCPRCKRFAYYVTQWLTDCRRCGLTTTAAPASGVAARAKDAGDE